MVRLSLAASAVLASALSAAAFAPAASRPAFAVGPSTATTTATTTTTARSMSSTTADDLIKSDGAKTQIGNDSFLNQDLMSRARNGPGRKNDEKLKIGIVGAGLAGMVAAMDLADAGHDVEMFELRPFVGGKVSSWLDKDGNHIEMGLHVFFGCYYNLFGIMQRTGKFEEALRIKEHVHTFVNDGGDLGSLDFRFPIGAPVSGLQAFFKTEQLEPIDKFHNAVRLGTSPIVRALFDFDGGMDMVRELDDITFTEWFTQLGGSRGSLDRMWDPIAYALGFVDCDHISARCMLTIFMLFAIRTEASVLRMLEGSPQTYLHDPIIAYLEERGVKINLSTGCRDLVHEVDEEGRPTRVTGIKVGPNEELREFDAVVAALDVPGIKKVLPENFRKYPVFDNIYNLECVPIATVQVRFDGWVTEMQDDARMMDVSGDQSDGRGAGIDNLLYSADAEFSCFADLALASPGEYYKEGEGSLIQAVFDERAFSRSNDRIVEDCIKQLNSLFPSSKKLNCTWSSVVKLGQSLYREKPGQDKHRPSQATPVENFFLAGSYTYQDYLDSMEGATRSGLMVADEIIDRADGPNGLKAKSRAAEERGTSAGPAAAEPAMFFAKEA
uniref:Zeta-carotene desaturase, chloroplastic/chromoplastic n=1 Tax=Trieres chinensis TaxID=1514140 RepID=A0A7S1ZRS1_TRICV|mmetsp:Transcript_31833/g.65024  ORF Transcript_31833/g.65024 Transcript_31833/m.65024 type:complete len:611 (+) Transcript_31833:199-2031(+)